MLRDRKRYVLNVSVTVTSISVQVLRAVEYECDLQKRGLFCRLSPGLPFGMASWHSGISTRNGLIDLGYVCGIQESSACRLGPACGAR